MECMAQEPILFEDILCQMIDMIGPEVLSLLLTFCIVSCTFLIQLQVDMLTQLQKSW